MSRNDKTCKFCNHPAEAHQPTCLVFMGDGEACGCDGKDETTPDKLTPEQRLAVAVNDALADAFQRGKKEGRGELIALLKDIVNATGEGNINFAILQAARELKKWGV